MWEQIPNRSLQKRGKLPSYQPRDHRTSVTGNLSTQVPLAHPKFYIKGKINMLLGAEHFYDLLFIVHIKGPAPWTVQKTGFGRVVAGLIIIEPSYTHSSPIIPQVPTSIDYLNILLEKFWREEELATTSKLGKNNRCEVLFEQDVSRDKSGCYTVGLPFTD